MKFNSTSFSTNALATGLVDSSTRREVRRSDTSVVYTQRRRPSLFTEAELPEPCLPHATMADPEGRAAMRLSRKIEKIYSRLRDPVFDNMDLVMGLSDSLVDPRTNQLILKVIHNHWDRADPGTLLVEVVKEFALATNHVIWRPEVGRVRVVSFLHLQAV